MYTFWLLGLISADLIRLRENPAYLLLPWCCVTNSFLFFLYCTIRYDRLPRGLACMACTGVSSRTGYDAFHSTMTCPAPITYCDDYLSYHDIISPSVGYKATTLQGNVSRVFLVHSSTIASSPSHLYPLPLPKDQTLKHVAQLGDPSLSCRTLLTRPTLSPHDSVSSLRIAEAPPSDLSSDNPVES